MTARVTLASTIAFCLCAPAALGQQFQEQTSTRFPIPNPTDYTNYVEAADIDNDGDLDLLFANGGNFSSQGAPQTLRVFINDGLGDFTDETASRTGGIVGTFRGVALGDIDDDDDLDMLIAVDFNGQQRLLINDGTGVFSDQSIARIGVLNLSATRGQFADIDNDGDLDIYINNGGPVSRFGCGQNQILINDGTGHFTNETAGRHPLGNVCEPMDVIFGDFDNDLDLDIRTGNRGSNNSKLYRNDGTGVFTTVVGVPGDSACYSYDFGDFNGDGNLDLLGANAGPSNTELLLQGNGAGGFTNVSNQILPNNTGDDNDSKFFDLDNDGDLDLIVASLFQSQEKIFLNNGSGTFNRDASRITNANDASLDVAVADFDGDDKLDIVTGNGESGSFVNRYYSNVTGPADTIAPNIEQVEQVADTTNTAGPYVVRAAIFDDVTSDHGFFDRGIYLTYSVNGGADQQVEMKWVGNSLWRGEIPGQLPCSTVEYSVTAFDYAMNQADSAKLSFEVERSAGDANCDGEVDVFDMLDVLNFWGPCAKPCPPHCTWDLVEDCNIDVFDLLEVLDNFS